MAAAPIRMHKTVIGIAGLFSNAQPAPFTKAIPTTSRIKTRPIPGQPPAKVEYKRRKWTHLSVYILIFFEFPPTLSPTWRTDSASFEAGGQVKWGGETYNSMMPRLSAMVVAWVRSLAPSL